MTHFVAKFHDLNDSFITFGVSNMIKSLSKSTNYHNIVGRKK